MRILFTIIGFVVGLLLGVVILSVFATSSGNSGLMNNSFVVANIFGIIGAILGYNMSGKKKTK